MNEQAQAHEVARIPSILGRIARATSLTMLFYWGLYALLAPVSNIDAMMFHLPRLLIAEHGGLFDNPEWNSAFQLCYPWTFDAVHLPLLHLGFGLALPSYACLAGTCLVVYRLLLLRAGADAAWAGVLGLLAMPMLVQQGTSNKNDLVLVFCGAVWLGALLDYLGDGRKRNLLWMALALGFMAGAKTTGLVFGLVLGVLSLWALRRDLHRALAFCGVCAGSLFVFGSVETYVETYRYFGDPLGPPHLSALIRNKDGARGTAANLVRYASAAIWFGPPGYEPGESLQTEASKVRNDFLQAANISDAGRQDNYDDTQTPIRHHTFEEYCGYGPLGMPIMAVTFASLLFWRPSRAWWRLAISALAVLVILSAMLTYQTWNGRYLMPAYALGSAALVLLLWNGKTGRSWWVARLAFIATCAAMAVAMPSITHNRRPVDLVSSVVNRQAVAGSCYPIAQHLIDKAAELQAQHPSSRVHLLANQSSVILPFLQHQTDMPVLSLEKVERGIREGLLRDGDLIIELSKSRIPAHTCLMEELSVQNPFAPNGPPQSGRILRVSLPSR